jgi:hypothetical protein
LWPHSVKNNPNKKEKKTILNNQEFKKEETSLNQDQSNNEENVDKNTTSTTTNNNNNNETDTNDKNKTFMCMMNELVKHNKIKHEYVLLDEIGPAHKKVFFVSLKLGIGTENEETFTGNGTSIKKAQHAAAEIALKETKFKHPVKRNKNNMPIQLLTASITNNNSSTTQSNINKDTNNRKIKCDYIYFYLFFKIIKIIVQFFHSCISSNCFAQFIGHEIRSGSQLQTYTNNFS